MSSTSNIHSRNILYDQSNETNLMLQMLIFLYILGQHSKKFDLRKKLESQFIWNGENTYTTSHSNMVIISTFSLEPTSSCSSAYL